MQPFKVEMIQDNYTTLQNRVRRRWRRTFSTRFEIFRLHRNLFFSILTSNFSTTRRNFQPLL